MCNSQPFKVEFQVGPRGFIFGTISVSKPTPWAVAGHHGQLASHNILGIDAYPTVGM